MNILLYQHCGSYLCGTNGRQSADTRNLQSLLDMPEEYYLQVSYDKKIEIIARFIYEAEAMIVEGLLEEQRYKRLVELWNMSTEWDRSHGFPHSLGYEYVPEWHKENLDMEVH